MTFIPCICLILQQTGTDFALILLNSSRSYGIGYFCHTCLQTPKQCIAIHGLQWRHQKFELTIFWTRFQHNVNNPILKDHCKLQVDAPIIAKVTAVESFKNLQTFILRQPCWWARERPQPIFPYNTIENSPTPFARNSVFVGPNDFKFGTETRFMVL